MSVANLLYRSLVSCSDKEVGDLLPAFFSAFLKIPIGIFHDVVPVVHFRKIQDGRLTVVKNPACWQHHAVELVDAQSSLQNLLNSEGLRVLDFLRANATLEQISSGDLISSIMRAVDTIAHKTLYAHQIVVLGRDTLENFVCQVELDLVPHVCNIFQDPISQVGVWHYLRPIKIYRSDNICGCVIYNYEPENLISSTVAYSVDQLAAICSTAEYTHMGNRGGFVANTTLNHPAGDEIIFLEVS